MGKIRVLTALLLLSTTACGGTMGAAPVGQTEGPVRQTGTLRADVVEGTQGVVATDAALATDVGIKVLQSGGNAIDAAVATAFTLAVVYPEAGNIGGGGFLVVRMANGETAALDFREKAPLAASRDMFLDNAGNVTSASLIGHLASGVPGSVAGLWAAHQRFGSKPWRELMAPAIAFAEQGFSIDAHFAAVVAAHRDRLARFPASAALFLPGGNPLQEGTVWKNPQLAAVLRRIAEQGPAGFYEGETARLIADEMKRGGGLITQEDLRRYQAKWREPVEFDYRGHAVISMPPASSGGLTLALTANILEGYDLRKLGWHTPATLHLITEASKRAFADRNHFLGDLDFVRVPGARFVSEDYAAKQRATISLNNATPSAQIRPGLTAVEGDHTTHFAVVDAHGNAVALTTTINELFGSAVTVTGGGFLLNDEMDDFTSKPGTPNLFGLVQGEANAIAPEKRMLSAMTPTIVLDPGNRPLLITGARGGPRIISAVFQVMSNVIDYELPLADALAAPRIHHQHLPDVLYYETNGLSVDVVQALRALGHTVNARDGYIGSGPTILRVGNRWQAAADPRSGGSAKAY
jgi:gamma-glutamyltranspeptidase/glutathione hydrolase